MSFNTALSGLRAANIDLNVTGNNIANASTVGFKQSRAEFADVYLNSVAGGVMSDVGDGVRVSSVAQQFSQGDIRFTENVLDMAINGEGFFVLRDAGEQFFTRAGQFKVDEGGYVSTNDGARLQSFAVDKNGLIAGGLEDLRIRSENIAPRQTTQLDLRFNLDADALRLASVVNTVSSEGIVEQAVQGLNNGYAAASIDVSGTTVNIPTVQHQPANEIAAAFAALEGVFASAETRADLSVPGGVVGSGDLRINGNEVSGNNLSQLIVAIDNLEGISASLNGTLIRVVATDGADLNFVAGNAFAAQVSGAGNSGISVAINGASPQSNFRQATVGGRVNLVLDEGVALSAATATTAGVNHFPSVPQLNVVYQNRFDPADPSSYNHVISGTVYDSLGGEHSLMQYFVKESPTLLSPNSWSLYVQVDGQDVGDASPQTPTLPTVARYMLHFNADGTLDTDASDTLLVSNWTPRDSNGDIVGALGPLSLADGAAVPIAQPPSSSNFVIDIVGSTQFSGDYALSSLDQDGYASGRFGGLDIHSDGTVFARYSNGESLALGQIALADFSNRQGLRPVGDTQWMASAESGDALFGRPLTASLGSVSSAALEDSNVELTEELVSLILAQRNFQANSRTIEATNEIHQTLINLS